MSHTRETGALVTLASIVIILTGIKLAQSIVVPFLLAIFIAFISTPMVIWFEKNLKFPKVVSFLISLVIVIGVLGIITNIIINSFDGFVNYLPLMKKRLASIADDFILWVNSYGLHINFENLPKEFDPTNIISGMGAILKSTSVIVSKSFLIFLMVTFMLFEASGLNHKLEIISRKNPQNINAVSEFTKNLNRYLVIKSLASLATGVIIATALTFMDVKYAFLWGVIACLLNFIPTIGSIVASIPAILISLVEYDLLSAFWVMVVFIVTNIAIGNFIEPRFLGKGLGLSALVVLLSLIFWGWILGIAGMFLAVPLTMSLKIALELNPDTKWVALALSNSNKK